MAACSYRQSHTSLSVSPSACAAERLQRSRVAAMTLNGSGYTSLFPSGRDSDREHPSVFPSHLLHFNLSLIPLFHICHSVFPISLSPGLCLCSASLFSLVSSCSIPSHQQLGRSHKPLCVFCNELLDSGSHKHTWVRVHTVILS